MMKLLGKMKEIRKNLHENKGFTLVELIVVIVILAILIGVSVSGYSKYIGQSKMNTDKNNAETVRAAIINAQAADGVYEELINIQSGTEVLTIKITNGTDGVNATSVSGSAAKLVDAVKKAVDTTTLKTQTTGGEITLTAKAQGETGKKSDGSVTVEITSNNKYPSGFIGTTATTPET